MEDRLSPSVLMIGLLIVILLLAYILRGSGGQCVALQPSLFEKERNMLSHGLRILVEEAVS